MWIWNGLKPLKEISQHRRGICVEWIVPIAVLEFVDEFLEQTLVQVSADTTGQSNLVVLKKVVRR
jgi:hypothetical protein